jgi:hypothetical protein
MFPDISGDSTMHATTIVHDVLRKACPHIHAARLHALLQATRAALGASSHTLSNLARALEGHTPVRYRVKRMDRLLGNSAMHRECAAVYAAVARHCLRGSVTPLIVVDWTDLNASRSLQMIRASVALEGRSLTVFEQVYAMKEATTRVAHQTFLAQLQAILPATCRPIIITDAGFRSPWFRLVEALGWHWIGRSRNRDLVRVHGAGDTPWLACKSLYARATGSALDLGLFDCVRNYPHVHRLVTIKHGPKGRVRPTVYGTRCRSNHSQKQARAQSEPWLLGVSRSLGHLSAQAVVALYAQRMQIEQAFRDTKNARFGLGLSNSASRTPARLAVLALIASLAEFVLRLMGQCAINGALQYDLQLTNRRTRPELSVIRVGRLLAHAACYTFSAAQLRLTMHTWAAPHPALRL